MIFLLLIIAAALIYLAYWATPQNLRRTLTSWFKTGWYKARLAAIKTADKTGKAAATASSLVGDFAEWVTDEFWVGLRTAIRRIAIFSVVNILVLIGCIYVPGMHDAILGWFAVNAILAIFGLEIFGIGTGIMQKLRSKDAAPAKRVLTRNAAIYFFTLAWLGASEWAVPGVLRYGGWIIVIMFSVLVLGEAWRVYTDATVGNLGGTVLIIYFGAMAAVGIYNQKIQPHQLDQYLLAHRYSAVNYGLTTKVEATVDLQVCEKRQTGWGFWTKTAFVPVKGDTVKAGTVIDVPVSREDYLEQNIPFEDFGRNRLIPYVSVGQDGFIDDKQLYVVMSGTRLWDEAAAKAAQQSALSAQQATAIALRQQAIADSLAKALAPFRIAASFQPDPTTGLKLAVDNPSGREVILRFQSGEEIPTRYLRTPEITIFKPAMWLELVQEDGRPVSGYYDQTTQKIVIS